MTYTEMKLKEAKFFLDRVEEFHLKNPEFDYYLNAYIASSRSVVWVMNNEFNKLSEWKGWYNSYDLNDEENKFLGKINQLRIISVKKHPLETSERIELEIVENTITENMKQKFKELKNKKVDVTLTVSDSNEFTKSDYDNEINFKAKLEGVHLLLNEFPNEDILEVCKKYYHLLESIVLDCLNELGHLVEKKGNWKRVLKFTNGDVLK